MDRVYNFSAGPSMLPVSVLEKAASEMLNYEGTGQSVMEMSHRSKEYAPIIEGAEAAISQKRRQAQHGIRYQRFFIQTLLHIF